MYVFDSDTCFYFDLTASNVIAKKEAPIVIDLTQSDDNSDDGNLPFSVLGADGQSKASIGKKRKGTYQQNDVDYLHTAHSSAKKRKMMVCGPTEAENADDEEEQLSTFFDVCLNAMFSKH